MNQKPVWIDADVAIGLPEADVDDGLALIQAFHSPELAVRGISVVFGNGPLDAEVPIAEEIVSRFAPYPVTVHAGARSADDLGAESAAVSAIVEALETEPLTILALGPLTNVATVLQRRPELASRVDAVVVVAGRRRGQSFRTTNTGRPFRDFNFELDVSAMRVVLDSGVELVLAPWEVSAQVRLTKEDLETLGSSGVTGAWIADKCSGWLELWNDRFGVDYFNPFDTLAVAWAIDERLVDFVEVRLTIENELDDLEPETGKKKAYLHAEETRGKLRRAIYCYRPSAGFKQDLLKRLSGPGSD